jgi:hypothetical protein
MAKKKPKNQLTILDDRLTRDEALALVSTYQDKRYGIQLTNNRSVYAEFKMNQLIEYLTEMQGEYNADGVRIYYGAKQVPVAPGDTKTFYAITPVLVPTISGINPDGGYVELFTTGKKINAEALTTGYDFASLCPPDGRHIKEVHGSLAHAIYGEGLLKVKKKAKKSPAKKVTKKATAKKRK